jgi:glycine dehydrogenase subunit 2
MIPDSAHGTNPASAAICGFKVFNLKSDANGAINLDALREAVDEDTVLLMLTNPSTLGLFEENVTEIANILHEKDALLYCDGANMNAMLGITRPGDQGVDILHLNLHKTFSTPHGGGGPGAGPVGVKKHLEEFLPSPEVAEKGNSFSLSDRGSKSVGRVRAFNGSFGVLLRAYTYIKAHGPELKKLAESAVLNANYIQENLKGDYLLPNDRRCAHECVLSADWQVKNGVHATDIAKRLLDYGFHAPTIYFPMIVSEALMIEPTESESKESLDSFIAAMKEIAREAREDPELVRTAPHNTPVGRLDGVLAARKPNLSYPL